MNTLYIINHRESIAAGLSLARQEDAILLIEAAAEASLDALPRPVHVLDSDRVRRATRNSSEVELIDMNGFVALVASHQPIVTLR